ncbi:MAG: DUF4410 domain-containing protein [Candidatus Acidiferrum sp.]
MRFGIRMMMVMLLLACLGAAAKEKNATPQFKTAEAKHFTQAEGVELSPAFGDYFYAELREELKKAKLAGEVIGEGETVDDADAPQSIVITGTFTEYKKGSVVKSALIGFGAGMRSLKMDADVLRRSDNQHLGVVHIRVKIDPRWDEKTMAKFAAHQIVKDMKEALKTQAK